MLWSGLTVINLSQISIVSPLIVTSFLNLTWRIPFTPRNQLFIAKDYGLKDCLSSLTFEKHLESIHSWFGNRDYLKKLVDNHLRRVAENRLDQLSEHQTKHGTSVPLVATYHPRFHDLGRLEKI